MEEESTVCTNCQRPIASKNYVMHSLHCHRKLEKCRTCGDAVPRSEMSEHAEHHAEESCSDCGEKVPRDLHEAHKANQCKLRKMCCAYCTLDVPGTELQEHEDYCGSRTERCTDCGKFVMLKYQQLHLDSNHSFLKLDDEPVPSPPPKLGDFLVKKSQKQSSLFPGLRSTDISSLDRLLALNLGEEESMMSRPNRSSASSSSFNSYPYTTDDDIVTLPCEFCHAVVPSDKLMDHQTGCNPEITSFPHRDTASKVEKTPVNSALHYEFSSSRPSASTSSTPIYTIDESDDEVTILNPDEREVELPCEFCDGAYPASLLTQHQEICESRLGNPAHHWSMPTPGARRITPPLTRKRLNAEATSNASGSQSSTEDTVTEEKAGPGTTNSNLNRARDRGPKHREGRFPPDFQ